MFLQNVAEFVTGHILVGLRWPYLLHVDMIVPWNTWLPLKL